MLRRVYARAGAAALMAGLMVVAAPSGSDAHPRYHDWGGVVSHDHVLRKGCHHYRYRYSVHPPTHYWAAEIFLKMPNGVGLASSAVDSKSDPAKGVKHWTICRPSTSYGRHTLAMKVTYCPESSCREPSRHGYVRPHTFLMKRPG